MAIDNNPASPYYGRMYVAWTDFDAGAASTSTYSTDGGTTWSAPVALQRPRRRCPGRLARRGSQRRRLRRLGALEPLPSGPIDIEVVALDQRRRELMRRSPTR